MATTVYDLSCMPCCGGGVTTCCCPGDSWQPTLTMEVKDPGSTTVGTVTLTYDDINDWWESGPQTIDGCSVDYFRFSCVPGVCMPLLGFRYTGGDISSATGAGFSCSPIMVTLLGSFGCFSGYTFIITE